MSALLDVRNLRVEFTTSSGVGKTVNGVDFSLGKGEILGIVGESGAGKTGLVQRLVHDRPPYQNKSTDAGWATHLALPGRHDLVFSAAGGFEGALSLALFYRALAMGAMGLTAALTGLLTALVPVIYSIFHDGLPTPLTAAGLAVMAGEVVNGA